MAGEAIVLGNPEGTPEEKRLTIALAGKGGVGKTTLAGLLIKY